MALNLRRLFHRTDFLKVKVKILPIQATKALRVGRGIALPFFQDFGTEERGGGGGQHHAPVA